MSIFGRTSARALWLCVAAVLALTFGVQAGHAETRFALVIGNDQYRGATLATPADDAGLVADALQAAGFSVTGARNLDQAALRETFREFIAQVSAAGPDTAAFVYLSGFGLQFNGENYFVPVGADIQRDVDVPLQALRISDFTQPLAALPARVKIVVVDAARENPFARGGEPLASGLALVDPIPGMAMAFNAAPGTVGPQEPGPYGAYATALTEMIAAGGLSLDDIFARVRLRVGDLTQGAEIPWYGSQIETPFFMTELAAGAPPPPNVMPLADVRGRPLRDFGNVDDAYAAVLELDTIEAYEQFLALYPNTPYSARIAGMLAVRREEIIWRRCVTVDTPPAYWSYLRRYPEGPHAWDARRRLAMLRAEAVPPPDFAFIDFGVPPPPPAELIFVDRPILIFAGPGWLPPPRLPVIFLPPRPPQFVKLPPPPPPRERFGLPIPRPAIIPVFVRPPSAVRLPPRGPGGAPNGQTRVPVSLPNAVQHPGASGGPEAHRPPPGGTPPGGAPIVSPTHREPPPPPSASVKPTPPPPHPSDPAPVTVKPAPPPHVSPGPAVVEPSPPNHPSEPRTPAVVKPVTPSPHGPPASTAGKPSPPKGPTSEPATVTNKPPPKPECPLGRRPTPEGCK
jgi:uncharacterized caspase-like protein